MNIFFDLDGTLIDSKERLYNLFQILVSESNLSFKEYWELKRNKIDHLNILQEKFKYSNNDYKKFKKKWFSKIESSNMLALDKKIDKVEDFLKKLSGKHVLYVITARQYPNKAKEQLEKLKLIHYFEDIIVTEQKYTKADLIKKHCKVSPNDFLIGDTGNDILAGKELGIKTIAITSGFVNKEKLLQYAPDFFYDKVIDIDFLLS